MLAMEILTPIYGYKSHICVNRRNGFICSFTTIDTTLYDGRKFPNLLYQNNTASPVLVETAYHSGKNER